MSASARTGPLRCDALPLALAISAAGLATGDSTRSRRTVTPGGTVISASAGRYPGASALSLCRTRGHGAYAEVTGRVRPCAERRFRHEYPRPRDRLGLPV